jgi:hypothetical protein
MIAELLRRENQIPEMRNEHRGLEARRVMINAMLISSMSNSSGSKDEWDRPENAALLALFAYQDEEVQEVTQEEKSDNKNKAKSHLLSSFKRKILRRSSKTPKHQDTRKESLLPSKDDGFLACLIITQRSNGKYERIGYLRKFWVMDGFSRVQSLAKVVELV